MITLSHIHQKINLNYFFKFRVFRVFRGYLSTTENTVDTEKNHGHALTR